MHITCSGFTEACLFGYFTETNLQATRELLTIPWSAMQVVLISGEAVQIGPALGRAETQLGGIALVALFLVFSLFGMLLNWSMFLCTMSNSALTTTIVGVLKVGYCLINAEY